MQQVIDAARLLGWLVYHPFDSRRSCPGWPDVAFCGHGQFFMAELKSEHGRLSPAQQSWIDALQQSNIECHIWRPGDFDTIVWRLSKGISR